MALFTERLKRAFFYPVIKPPNGASLLNGSGPDVLARARTVCLRLSGMKYHFLILQGCLYRPPETGIAGYVTWEKINITWSKVMKRTGKHLISCQK